MEVYGWALRRMHWVDRLREVRGRARLAERRANMLMNDNIEAILKLREGWTQLLKISFTEGSPRSSLTASSELILPGTDHLHTYFPLRFFLLFASARSHGDNK